jgi:DNA-directed RNA polymerase subunit K/omega
MAKEMLELEIDKLEKRGINRYKAVLMAAQEARFLNDQSRLDIAKFDDKPTTVAIQRLFDGRVVADMGEKEKT